ncbi:MAG: hypothetical protein GY696_09030, partial [Gammaproteobacteria bacterium]|nr:hypothetical protein [Gammaproteobacteria bacterium]
AGDTQWQVLLPGLAMAYNSKINVSTGVTPALAFLGHELAMPVDLILQQETQPHDDMVSGVRMLLDRYNRMYRLMSEKSDGIPASIARG